MGASTGILFSLMDGERARPGTEEAIGSVADAVIKAIE